MRLRGSFIIAVCFFRCAVEAQSQGFECVSSLHLEDASRVVPGIEASYAKIESLKADFVQNSFFAGLEQGESSAGQVFFKKPGMMDWEYIEPHRQRFIGDGVSIWFYQPELNQVTVSDFRRSFSSDLPVSFLLGLGRLSLDFKLRQACVSERGIVAELQPIREDSGLQEFKLLVERGSYTPLGARVVDVSGNTTAITLQNAALNPRLNSDQFKFSPPRGVDVIDGRTLDSSAEAQDKVFSGNGRASSRISESDLTPERK